VTKKIRPALITDPINDGPPTPADQVSMDGDPTVRIRAQKAADEEKRERQQAARRTALAADMARRKILFLADRKGQPA